jgi:nucleotide-binding universal stress UspA family protein
LRRCRDATPKPRGPAAIDANIDASETLLEGDARELLARESGELDLLMVGSRGFGPLRAVLLGSISNALVRSAQSPLVVIPRGAEPEAAP